MNTFILKNKLAELKKNVSYYLKKKLAHNFMTEQFRKQ